MKNKTVIWIVIILILFIVGYLYFTRKKDTIDTVVMNPVVCTMEAKLCPDGSSVGRSGPDCAFAACPTPIVVTPATIVQPISPADLYK